MHIVHVNVFGLVEGHIFIYIKIHLNVGAFKIMYI